MRIFARPDLSLAPLAAFTIAATFIAGPDRAAAAICPQFLARYCVIEKDGYKHADWTNPCFAKERGVKVLHMGACKAK
jgi:hypothetical protein